MDGTDPFMVSIDAWLGKARAQADRVLQATAEEALARVKELTPVKTGYLRANWTIVKGGKAQAIAGERTDDSLAVILSLRAGDTFTLLNPVVYAARVNYGFTGEDKLGRHYDQKGAHMLEQVTAELPQLVAKAAERVGAQA